MRRWPVLGLGCAVLVAVLVAVLLVVASLVPVAAQTGPAAPQILTLDQDRLYANSRYGRAMEGRAAAASQALAAENRRIEADLATEEADLTQKRATTAVAAFQVLADAFDAKVEQVRTDQAAKADALKAHHEAGRKVFFQAAVPVLADLMRQLGAYAILNHDAVVLSFDAIDVTDRAIKALDQKLGDGSTSLNGPRVPSAPGVAAPDGSAATAAAPTVPAPTVPAPTVPSPTVPAPTAPALILPAPAP